MILVIDNYDSFTWNLVQYLGELGAEMEVRRNDELTVDEIAARAPERIVVSPGPCTPNEAGVSVEVIRRLGPTTPILGVCLGHQSIGAAYGGDIVRAGRVMHGKTSPIRHTGEGIFRGVPMPLAAALLLAALPRPLAAQDVRLSGDDRSPAAELARAILARNHYLRFDRDT